MSMLAEQPVLTVLNLIEFNQMKFIHFLKFAKL